MKAKSWMCVCYFIKSILPPVIRNNDLKNPHPETNHSVYNSYSLNPLTAGAAYIRVFIFN